MTLLLRMLLYPAPDIRFGTDERAAFDRLAAELKDGRLVPYGLPWPKARFLQDLAVTGDFLFHGSNRPDIGVFEPRKQTLYNGAMTKSRAENGSMGRGTDRWENRS